MNRDDWTMAFVTELQRLRPHTPLKLAFTLAYSHYATGLDPKQAARDYAKAQAAAAKQKGK
jgi:hypothetical protein